MTNVRQKPGLIAKIDLKDFGPQEIEIIHNLSTIWFVAHAKVGRIGRERLPCVFLKPTDEFKEKFGFYRNLLCVLHPYYAIDGRVFDCIDKTLASNPNRLDHLCVLLVSNASTVVEEIGRYTVDKEARVIVPFRYSELSGGVAGKRDLVTRRIEDNVFTRDLFAISSALKTDRYFFGRSADIRQLVGKYNGCENGSVFGLRRIGKTSVLWAIVREAKNMNAPVAFIDCTDTRFHKARWNQSLFRIKQVLFRTNGLGDRGHQQQEYSEEDASICFTEDLQAVKKAFQKPALLIFDEIENLCFDLSPTEHWANGPDYLSFWQTIRSVFQQSPNLFCFLVCGINPKALETPLVLSNKDNPLYRYIEPSYLGCFDVTDVTSMVSHIGQYMGMHFDPEVFTYLPGGHLKFLHLWPGQNPPGADGRNMWIVTRNRWPLQGGWPRVSSDSFCL